MPLFEAKVALKLVLLIRELSSKGADDPFPCVYKVQLTDSSNLLLRLQSSPTERRHALEEYSPSLTVLGFCLFCFNLYTFSYHITQDFFFLSVHAKKLFADYFLS